jgi:small subunit ribosomal protein S1
MRLKGKVRNVVEFGAFVDIGVGRDGLVHISSLKRAGVDQTVKVGDVIEVSVRRIDADENRISLTIPLAEDSKASLRDLRPNSVVTGRVIRLVDFGAFVDIGAQSDGLLHVSQMAGGYVSHPSQVLKVGDEIQVRISEVDPRKRRISLTMRDLDAGESQESGGGEETKPEERVPTAFEVAFEKARVSSRRRRARRP